MAIRTLTEFSGTLIRMAAKAETEAKKSLPTESAPAAAAPVSTETEATTPAEPVAAAAEGTEAAAATEPAAEGAEAAAPDAAAEPVAEAQAKVEAKPAVEAAESEAAKAALDEAVSKATGTTGDRLARLREALHAAGRSADRVRLVRVFGGEDVVAGAKKIGEHQFLVDLMPASMKQVFKDPKEEKKSFGPKRPSGSTKNKNDASLEGSFSMDTVAQDRKSERGAPGSKRPGGPGGAPGARPGGNRGGRPGGNGPPRSGGRTSGAPKP
jgi:hypothetical protein